MTAELSNIKVNKSAIYVFDGYEDDANGHYSKYSSDEMDQLPVTLYGNKVQYIFEHQLNQQRPSFYAIIKCKLKSHQNGIYWIIISIDKKLDILAINEFSDLNVKLLYLCKDRVCAPLSHPPCFNWKVVIHQNIDNIDNKKVPIIIKGDDYFGYTQKKSLEELKCSETDFHDTNIYDVIPLDVERYSTQHSYYKHLSLNGDYYTVVPQNGGQRRNGFCGPLNPHQIRWHTVTIEYLTNNDGKHEIEDINDWIWIKDIAIKNKFRLNCFLGGTNHGNWSIAIRKNFNSIQYLENKYPHFKGFIEQHGYRGNTFCKMIYDEEHMIQVENAINCAQQIHTEINQVIVNWRKVASIWSLEQNAPTEVCLEIEQFCNIKLIDWYLHHTW